MINLVTGSIFDDSSQCLVNPVNCVGVMGKGLAAEFKVRYPGMFVRYQALCRTKELIPGTVALWQIPNDAPRYICLFPTKFDWRKPSLLSYIEDGMRDFVRVLKDAEIEDVAMPMIGCGLGGLSFTHQVLPLMVTHLQNTPTVINVHTAP